MPWGVFKKGDQYCLYKLGADDQPTGDSLGCHATEAEAQAQQRALYASENAKFLPVKFAEGSEVDIEGLLAPNGGPFQGRDLAGEYFSTKTDFVLDWFAEDARPIIYHHGLDPNTQSVVVGRMKKLSKDDLGLWMQGQLDAANEYYDAIKELIAKGKLGLSSGSLGHLVKIDHKSGEIVRWPLIEGSLTPTPCNPLAKVDFAAAKSHFDAIGSELPAHLEGTKAPLDAAAENALDDSDFAYIDSEGGRHLPINDAAHTRNALARFDQTNFESADAKEKAKKKVLAAAHRFGIETADGKEGKSVDVATGSTGGNTSWADNFTTGTTITAQICTTYDGKFWFYDAETKMWRENPVVGGNTGMLVIPNADGTTTTIKLSNADMPPMEGDAHVADKPVSKKPAKMSEDMIRQMMKDMAKEMDMAMSSEEMDAMMGKMGDMQDMSEAQAKEHMRQMLQKHKKSVKAESWEEIRRECENLIDKALMAQNPFMDDGYAYVMETYSDPSCYVIACVYRGGEQRFYSVPFQLGEDGHVASLGTPVEVEQEYVPVSASPDMPMAMHAEMAKYYASSLVERTKDLHQRRLKEGRVLSNSNRKRLGECLDAMRTAVEELHSLLMSAEPLPKEGKAKADNMRLRLQALDLYKHTFN